MQPIESRGLKPVSIASTLRNLTTDDEKNKVLTEQKIVKYKTEMAIYQIS